MGKCRVGIVWFGVALVAIGCVVEGRGRSVRVVPVVPPARVEVVVPRPGPAHVWVPGHWNWVPDRGEYGWTPGVWVVPATPRHVWVSGHWAAHPEGHEWREGHWELRP